jgi:hypothetical protein
MQPKGQPAEKTKIVEKFVLKDGQLARLEKAGESIGDLSNRLFDLTGTVQGLWKDIKAAVQQTREPQRNTHATMTQRVDRQVPVSPRVHQTVPAATASRPVHAVSHDGGPLPPGEVATLTAALQYPGLDRKRLGILTGYKRSSRDAYIARLASKGLVEVTARRSIRRTPDARR